MLLRLWAINDVGGRRDLVVQSRSKVSTNLPTLDSQANCTLLVSPGTTSPIIRLTLRSERHHHYHLLNIRGHLLILLVENLSAPSPFSQVSHSETRHNRIQSDRLSREVPRDHGVSKEGPLEGEPDIPLKLLLLRLTYVCTR